MKKVLSMILVTAAAFSMAGCGGSSSSTATTAAATEAAADAEETAEEEAEEAENEEENTAEETNEDGEDEAEAEASPESITITALDGAGQPVEIQVPYDPQRIVVVDLACLDILDNLGVGDRVVGATTTTIDYLQDYIENDDVAMLGNVKEVDMEKVMACEPDIIFMGGRMAESYDALGEIAPVVRLTTDTEIGLVESVRKNATTIASIFGLDDEIDEKMAQFDARIGALCDFAEGKTALVGMCTSGGFNLLGNDGRCALIGTEIGFDNLGASGSTSTHGNETSFELIVSLNPDYIFVMDRDAAIGTDGAQLAPEIVENELVMKTDAYQNGNIVYLEHPGVWYTAEGGITAFDYMLADLEQALLQ